MSAEAQPLSSTFASIGKVLSLDEALSCFDRVIADEDKIRDFFSKHVRPWIIRGDLRVDQARDIYPLYHHIGTVSDYVMDEGSNASRLAWRQLLLAIERANILVMPDGCDASPLRFPINTRCLQKHDGIELCTKALVHHRGEAFDRVTRASHQISRRALGWSYGRDILELLLSQNDSYCCTVQSDKGDILGVAFGTYHYYWSDAKDLAGLRIFHIWQLVREPEAGGMGVGSHLCEKLSKKLSAYSIDGADLVSFRVPTSNGPMRDLLKWTFKDEGPEPDVVREGDQDVLFYRIPLNVPDDYELPSREQIDAVVTRDLKRWSGCCLRYHSLMTGLKMRRAWESFCAGFRRRF